MARITAAVRNSRKRCESNIGIVYAIRSTKTEWLVAAYRLGSRRTWAESKITDGRAAHSYSGGTARPKERRRSGVRCAGVDRVGVMLKNGAAALLQLTGLKAKQFE